MMSGSAEIAMVLVSLVFIFAGLSGAPFAGRGSNGTAVVLSSRR
jgi:hypothetical protein